MNGEAVTERSGGILEAMAQVRVIPVATLESEAEARILADALQEAGILILEVTFRTAAAAAVIRYLRRADPLLRIGAGTILSPEQAEQAVAAGAEFLVSPGWEPELGRWCQERGILLIPGVATPSEVGVTQLGPNWVILTAIYGVFWPITRHMWGSLPANCVSPKRSWPPGGNRPGDREGSREILKGPDLAIGEEGQQHSSELFGHSLGDGLGQQVVRAHREVRSVGFEGSDGQDGQPTRRQDLTRLFSVQMFIAHQGHGGPSSWVVF
jgi:hypothetical protein